MAFNIRRYLGIDGTPGVINHDDSVNPIPDDLLDRLDTDINDLISYITGAKTRKPPTNAAEFERSLCSFVSDSGLDSFYPPGHPLLKEVSKRAEALLNDKTAVLNTPAQLEVRSKGALYDVVIYCDDSYSMQADNRIQVQKEFAGRVCDIITPLTPEGIYLRFINDNGVYDELKTFTEVGNIIASVPYNSYTQIGTMMQNKILEPLMYQKIRAGTLKKPLLIIVITDGWPYNEPEDHFRNMILKSKAELKANRKGKRSLIFQVNQIGSDPNSEQFIRGLFEDKELEDIVYCTSEKLDDQIAKLKENNDGLNEWLFDILKTTVAPPPKKQKKRKT